MFARTMLRIGSGARLRVATLRSNVGVRRSLHRSPAMFRGIVPTQPNALAASAAEAAEAGGGAGGAVERYAGPLRWLHWIMGGGALSCIGLVLLAQDEGKKPKGEKDGKKIGFYMKLHKSFGLCMLGLIPMRLAVRVGTKEPPLPPGNVLEKIAAHVSHATLYGLLVFLPVSGFTMGYYGGKGLPFFPDQGGTVITPKSGEFGKAANGAWAKWAYQNHKLAGQALEYIVPMHIGAVGFHHIFKGQNILTRVNPFAR